MIVDGVRDASDVDTVAISVIIVTYNSAQVIENAIAPLSGSTEIEIIVVDNSSIDNTVKRVTEMFPDVRVIETGSNLGFARAVNIGVAEARHSTLFLLNPDASISRKSVCDLARYMSKADVGITAPIITHPNGRLGIVSAGRFPSLWRMFSHYSGLSRMLPGSIFEGHYLLPGAIKGLPVETEWVTGAALMTQRSVWDEVGGLSERWFMYAEDIEYCYRVHQRGLKVLLVPSITAMHSVGGSDSTESGSKNPAWIVNLYDFYRRDISSGLVANLGWAVVVAAGLVSRAAVYSLRSKMSSGPSRAYWGNEARRFQIFSVATLRAFVAGPKKRSKEYEA